MQLRRFQKTFVILPAMKKTGDNDAVIFHGKGYHRASAKMAYAQTGRNIIASRSPLRKAREGIAKGDKISHIFQGDFS